LIEYRTPESQSKEPTWLLGVGYHPTSDMMLYGKYTRGYRQGNVNIAGTTGFDTSDPETVDSYEIGAKTNFYGRFPGTFNVAVFYNDLQDQQVQFGYFKFTGVGTTAVVNAGGSTVWGTEVEGNVYLLENVLLSGSYTYLNTNVDEIAFPDIPSPQQVSTTTAEGEPLPYSPKNKFAGTLSYLVPVDAELGDMRASVTYAWIDEMQAVSSEASAYATLPDYGLLNLNFDWNGIAGKPVDMSIFATNVTDEEYITSISGTYNNGVETGQVGVPRMYGVRLRYNFGK
jgi:iron complex outermembrane recepter protein